MALQVARAVLLIAAVSIATVPAVAQGTSILEPSVDAVQVSPAHSIRVARYANEPLRVTGITNSFDDERWLDGLLIEVENVSDRPVSMAKYYLRFGPRSATAAPLVLRFWYGDPVRNRSDAAVPSAMLQPGERATLRILRGEEPHSPVGGYFPRDVVPLLEPLSVGFGDGTWWELGQTVKR